MPGPVLSLRPYGSAQADSRPPRRIRGYFYGVPGTLLCGSFLVARFGPDIPETVLGNIPVQLVAFLVLISSLLALPLIALLYFRTPNPRPLVESIGFAVTLLLDALTVGMIWLGV